MVYYTGDIHGNAKGIVAFAQYFELTESDIIVILGDVGANYYGTMPLILAVRLLPQHERV